MATLQPRHARTPETAGASFVRGTARASVGDRLAAESSYCPAWQSDHRDARADCAMRLRQAEGEGFRGC